MPRQIPVTYMPETIQVYLRDYESEYDDGWLDPFEIKHVRFERAEQLSSNVYKLSDGAKGRVWIDTVNSTGATKVPIGSKVVIDEESFIVSNCMAYKCGTKVHHWELDIV